MTPPSNTLYRPRESEPKQRRMIPKYEGELMTKLFAESTSPFLMPAVGFRVLDVEGEVWRRHPPWGHGGELRHRARRKRGWGWAPLARFVSADIGRRRRREPVRA